MGHIYTGTMAEPLLTPAQIGKRLSVSGKTIIRWTHEGKIPAEVAEGQIYRFDPESVAKALKSSARSKAKQKRRQPLA